MRVPLISFALIGLTRLLVGAYPRWVGGVLPTGPQRIYFANHTSHMDTLVIWAALPPRLRRCTRTVAALDYWGKKPAQRLIAMNGFNAVFVDREKAADPGQPPVDRLAPLCAALEAGESLIIFPEGTRGAQSLPGAFKSGLYNLAQRFPSAELVPIYLENPHRAMPKGTWYPVPITCSVRFGAALDRRLNEPKDAFLSRARDAVVHLVAPPLLEDGAAALPDARDAKTLNPDITATSVSSSS